MEYKTDLSGEFGHSSTHSQQEFSSTPHLLDCETDLLPEFHHLPNENTSEPGNTRQDKEFSSKSSAPEKQQKNPRKKHRRTLLLQMAAVGLSVVVVTNSFGGDILGLDKLFSPSEPSHEEPSYEEPSQDDPPYEEPPHEESTDNPSPQLPSYLSLTPRGETSPVFLFQNGQTTDHKIPSVQYNAEINTLTLTDYSGGVLHASNMGDNFTLYLDGKNSLECILVDGDSEHTNSLTIDGEYKASLSVNKEQAHPIGLRINNETSSGFLSIAAFFDLDVYGHETALVVSNNGSTPGIQTSPVTMMSGDIIQSFFPIASATDWTVSGPESGSNTPGTHVSFHATFSVDYSAEDGVIQDITLYENEVYDNPYVYIKEIDSYAVFSADTTVTVTNTNNPAPIYIYYRQYTVHDEPFLVPWAQNAEDWESESIPMVDLSGKYYSYGGIRYLAKDGDNLVWNGEFIIGGDMIHPDAVLLNPGESITITLPNDGSDSIYRLHAETYFPEIDYSYWIYINYKFENT